MRRLCGFPAISENPALQIGGRGHLWQNARVKALEAWTNFYVIVGSAGGALTGLQFVVAALVADTGDGRAFASASSAFSTPTVVHFTVVLILAGVLCAPWHTIGAPMLVIGTGGVAGVLYTVIVGRRARRQDHYRPVLEDWIFHVALPAAAYAGMIVAATTARVRTEGALFGIGTSAILLLIVGIHNAWDSVTYIVSTHADRPANRSRRATRAHETPEE